MYETGSAAAFSTATGAVETRQTEVEREFSRVREVRLISTR